MRNVFRLAFALCGVSALGAAFLLACSEDTSVEPVAEAGVPGSDARLDSAQADSAEVDAGFDAADTAPPFDGGYVVTSFDTLIATEMCKSLARCCYGTATPAEGGADGGTFDLNGCITNLGAFGFQGSNTGIPELKDAGHIVLDQVAADDCVNKVKALKCDLPGTDYVAARKACFEAYSGTFAATHACNGSAECKRGLFCKGQVDGGPGVCAAIRPLGGPCGDNPDSLTEYEEACSYRGGGDTGNYCNWGTVATGVEFDAGDWKCAAAGDAGMDCFASTWCKDTICNEDTYTCKTPDRLFDSACARFVKK